MNSIVPNSVSLPPCPDDIFRKGHLVCILPCVPKEPCEIWVRKVAATSGQRVDWHYAGGRNMIKALGDLKKVADAVHALKDEILPFCGNVAPMFP